MAKSATVGGEVFASKAPKGDKKLRPKKSKGESSMANHVQQHGELSSEKTPREMTRLHAKNAMQSATSSWVSGHMTSAEHGAVTARAKHVLSGKRPHEFKGKSGERKIKGL